MLTKFSVIQTLYLQGVVLAGLRTGAALAEARVLGAAPGRGALVNGCIRLVPIPLLGVLGADIASGAHALMVDSGRPNGFFRILVGREVWTCELTATMRSIEGASGGFV